MADQSLTDFSQAVKELAKAQRETNDTLKTVGQTVGKEVVSAGQSIISPFTSALSQIPGFSQFANITKILGKQLVSKVKERNDKNLLAKQLGLSKAEFKSLERQKKIQDAQAKHLGTMESAAQSLLGMSKEEVKKRRLERTGGGKEKEQKIKKERKEKKQQDVLMEIAKNTKKTVETEQESSKLDTIREIVQTKALLTIARNTKKHTKLTEKFIKQQHKDLMAIEEASENKESKKGFLSMIGLAAIFTMLAPMLAAILPIIKILGIIAVGIPLAVMLGIGAVFGAKKLFGLLPSIFDFILDWKSNFFFTGNIVSRSRKAIVDAVINPKDPVTTPLGDEALWQRRLQRRDIFDITDSPTSEQLQDAVGTPAYAGLAMTIDQQRNIKLREELRQEKLNQQIRKNAENFQLSAMQKEQAMAEKLADFKGKLTAEKVLRDFKAAEAFKSDIAKPYSTEALMQIGTLKAAREAVTLKNKTDKEEDAFTFRMKEKIKMGHELSMGERLEMRYIQERKEAEAALQRLETARQGGTGAGMGETNVAIDASTQSERDVLLPTSFAANLHRRKEYFLEAGNLATA